VKTKRILLATGIIAAVLVLSTFTLDLLTPSLTPPGSSFDLKTRGYDSLNMYSILKEGVNYDCFWVARRGDGWLLLGKGDATVEVAEQDGSYIYAFVRVVNESEYYVDVAETKAKNPRVMETVLHGDLDGDGHSEYAFRLSLKNVPKPVSGNPTVYFYPYFLSYQKPRINNSPDVNGTGTRYVDWQLSLDEKKAFAMLRVEFQINTTNATKVKLARLNVPGVGYLTEDNFGTPVNNSKTLMWTYIIGENPLQAVYIKNGGNVTSEYKLTVMVESSLAPQEVVSATITIFVASPSGEEETVADTVLFFV